MIIVRLQLELSPSFKKRIYIILTRSLAFRITHSTSTAVPRSTSPSTASSCRRKRQSVVEIIVTRFFNSRNIPKTLLTPKATSDLPL